MIMSVANTLQQCLESKGSLYEVVHHPYTNTSYGTALAAHIPGDCLAKTVLLEDEFGYVAAVVPSTHHLRLHEVWRRTGRHLQLASEREMLDLFRDCAIGALPPVGMDYGMPTYLDESLLLQPDVYFEAGDHQALIHMTTDEFLDLMAGAKMVRCSYPV
jgi:Ala-tRNA(Pro) deacylase